MANQAKYGKAKEQQVAQALRSRGARVQRSPGSRGAADLRAQWPTGTKWHVQVKSSRTGQPPTPSKRDLGRLKQGATKNSATPVLANVTQQGIEYQSAKTGRTLRAPKSG